MTYESTHDELLDAAEALVIRHRQATKSLLQRHLKVGYVRALMLMEGLQLRGVVTPANPFGHRILTTQEPCVPKHDQTQRTARSLCDLALTFLECREEGIEPHSLSTRLCLDQPALKFSHSAAKRIARQVLDAASPTPVSNLALAFGQATELGRSLAWPETEHRLRNVCAGVDRPISPVTSQSEKEARSFRRALRYLERRIRDGEDPHTRVWDAFVPMAYVPQGRQRGVATPSHPEHVVPCKSLATEATRLLRAGMDFEVVRRWVQPYLAVVWIDQLEADRFDRGGDLKDLKHAMPRDWAFGVGCRYERLHRAGIEFDASPDYACGQACVAS